MKTLKDLNKTELENQTVGYCIDFGIASDKAIQLIEEMRKFDVKFLSKQKVSEFKNFKSFSDGKICFPYGFFQKFTATFNEDDAREILEEQIEDGAERFYRKSR